MAIRRPAPPMDDELRSRYAGLRMTPEEFEALPEEKPALEYRAGVVLQKAVAKRKHSVVMRKLVVAFDAHSIRHGGESGPDWRVYLPNGDVLVPDLCYWAPGKPQGTDDRSLPPTLAVEIRSNGESVREQREKCRHMRANGVDVCWFIDPEARTAKVFEGESDALRLADDGQLESAFLPGFCLPLRDLWAALEG